MFSIFQEYNVPVSKRSFLGLVAAQGLALALVACGGDDDNATPAGSAPGAGGAAGSLVISGTSNIPDAATAITPDFGLPAGSSTATVRSNLLNVAISSLVNSASRVFSVPLAGTAPPAVGSTYSVVVDGSSTGSVLTLIVAQVLTGKNYAFTSQSGTVKIAALSATSVDLTFTNVTLQADRGADNNSATGTLILNGTVTVKRV